jgi:hypothetical protein
MSSVIPNEVEGSPDLRLDLLYRPTVNDFRGRTAIEAQITAINSLL